MLTAPLGLLSQPDSISPLYDKRRAGSNRRIFIAGNKPADFQSKRNITKERKKAMGSYLKKEINATLPHRPVVATLNSVAFSGSPSSASEGRGTSNISSGDITVFHKLLAFAYGLSGKDEDLPVELDDLNGALVMVIILLEGIKSDIIQNPYSFVHQSTTFAGARIMILKKHVIQCKKKLFQLDTTLTQPEGKSEEIKDFGRFDIDKRKIQGSGGLVECGLELLVAVCALDSFMVRQGLRVQGEWESVMERIAKKVELEPQEM